MPKHARAGTSGISSIQWSSWGLPWHSISISGKKKSNRNNKKAPDGQWHALWSLNDEDGAIAPAVLQIQKTGVALVNEGFNGIRVKTKE
ncbi:hypothetical protein D7D25_05555 [Proteiniphilum sp. X52]|nr:hypothetical protein D7D25_05555 [Proteiniphilum sp. X52]